MSYIAPKCDKYLFFNRIRIPNIILFLEITEFRILFSVEKIRILNTEYYLVSRKSECQIWIVLFGPTIWIPNTKYRIVYYILKKIKVFVSYKTFCSANLWNYLDRYSLQLFEYPNTIWGPKKPEYRIPNTIQYWENPNIKYKYYYLVQLFK